MLVIVNTAVFLTKKRACKYHTKKHKLHTKQQINTYKGDMQKVRSYRVQLKREG